MSIVLSLRRFVRRPILLRQQLNRSLTQSKDSAKKAKSLLRRTGEAVLYLSPVLAILISQNFVTSHCAADEKDEVSKTDGKNDPMESIIDQAFNVMAPLGFGGVFGFVSGYALKKVGEKAAYAVGLTFIGLQGLAYLGYIKIDYGKVKSAAETLVDVDKDGKITANDFKIMFKKLRDILTSQLPQAGGFSAGFALGVYYC